MKMWAGLIAAAVPVLSLSANGGCDNVDHSFDYLLLVQQWPGAFNNNRTWATLHGLWPSRSGPNDSGSYPCQCTDVPFDPTGVAPFLADMQKYWPSLKGANDEFWAHEWTKHGTCAAFADETAFFKETLALRSKYSFFTALTVAGMSPGNTYSATQLQTAIKNHNGADPLLGCVRGTNNLAEVSFCISKATNTATECTASVEKQGGETTSCNLSEPIAWIKAGEGPTPAPGTQCIPNTHGPACTTNANCTKFKGCIRCAHSGFCTDEPDL
jgi:ribonuclease T2